MPIVIKGEGPDVKPVFVDPVVPSSTRVPSRREVLSALSTIEKLAKDRAPLSFDILRRFVLTR